MLYEIIAVILCIYAAISPFIVIKAVKFGMKCAEDPQTAAEEPVFNVDIRKEAEKPAVLSPEEQQIIDILENIDVFDGTSTGQKEIKEI